MGRSNTLRITALSCLLGCAATGYLLYVDRQTPVALNVVELQSMVPIPVPGLLATLGALLMFLSFTSQPPAETSSSRRRDVPKRTHPKAFPQNDVSGRHSISSPGSESKQQTEETWWRELRISCNGITLPAGARITLEPTRPCPIILHLEMAPPERCKRAIRIVAAWFSSFSTPPRFRIAFDHCPEGPSPRHHMVNGAIANEMDRGAFKVISDRDSVEVLFHHPDPRWKIPQPTG